MINNAYSKDLGALDIEMPANPKSITSEGSTYTYDGCLCSIACGGSCGGCRLYRKGNKIIYWFDYPSRRSCVVNPSDYALGNEICQEMTKKSVPDTINQYNDAFYYF